MVGWGGLLRSVVEGNGGGRAAPQRREQGGLGLDLGARLWRQRPERLDVQVQALALLLGAPGGDDLAILDDHAGIAEDRPDPTMQRLVWEQRGAVALIEVGVVR